MCRMKASARSLLTDVARKLISTALPARADERNAVSLMGDVVAIIFMRSSSVVKSLPQKTYIPRDEEKMKRARRCSGVP
jgi:hypothetical protein